MVRPKWRWLYLYLPLAVILLLAGTLVWAYQRFDNIGRVDLGDALTPATGKTVNYLLVGSDSRDGITSDTPNSGAIGTQVAGSRSDTIIVLRTNGSTAQMMSIPRDLWATNAATGNEGKINGAYNQGPANLVRTVTQNLGIPINHYMEVDFVSFSGIVDAMGGIVINFPSPAYDKHSGLNIITAGPVKLNGTQALAYVRSRHYVSVIDGKAVPDPTADLGREERQQNFIRTVLHGVGETRNPWTLARIASAGAKGMKVDTALGFGDAFSLVRNLAGTTPKTVVLPTANARKGREAALVLQTGPATPVLAGFGGAPHTPS
jgi:LCP family protein required for cell wall assembly